jgi:hypothetical protein
MDPTLTRVGSILCAGERRHSCCQDGLLHAHIANTRANVYELILQMGRDDYIGSEQDEQQKVQFKQKLR